MKRVGEQVGCSKQPVEDAMSHESLLSNRLSLSQVLRRYFDGSVEDAAAVADLLAHTYADEALPTWVLRLKGPRRGWRHPRSERGAMS